MREHTSLQVYKFKFDLFMREHTNKSEHAPHFEQQHRKTCYSCHVHRGKWSIPLQEYLLPSILAHIPHGMLR